METVIIVIHLMVIVALVAVVLLCDRAPVVATVVAGPGCLGAEAAATADGPIDSGSNAAVPDACAAVSGANTPSMRPLPKLSGSLEKRFARL